MGIDTDDLKRKQNLIDAIEELNADKETEEPIDEESESEEVDEDSDQEQEPEQEEPKRRTRTRRKRGE